jgi:hypothetical protein
MIVKNFQGIGDDLLVGRQGFGHVRINPQPQKPEQGAATDNERNNQEERKIEGIFFHYRTRKK